MRLDGNKGPAAALPRVVTIGGGTGSYQALRGLRDLPVRVSAVVSVFDSGGSSGAIREELGQLPPGDIRQCLLALSTLDGEDSLVADLFGYRFQEGKALRGHSLGNLALAALTALKGGLPEAIAAAQRLLRTKGEVLPVSICDAHLAATLDDGTEVLGEAEIDQRKGADGRRNTRVWLTRPARAYPPVAAAIAQADLIVLGPGDLYTSLLPNFLVGGVAEALAAARAPLALALNLMTKPGETDGYRASDFVSTTESYLGRRLDYLLVNSEPAPPSVCERYAGANAFPVEVDRERCLKLVWKVVEWPLLTVAGDGVARHDSVRLAAALLELLRHAPESAPMPQVRRAG